MIGETDGRLCARGLTSGASTLNNCQDSNKNLPEAQGAATRLFREQGVM